MSKNISAQPSEIGFWKKLVTILAGSDISAEEILWEKVKNIDSRLQALENSTGNTKA